MITPAYAPTATERVLPRMALDFTTAVLDSRVTVTRALNTATRVNSSGYVETVNADLPRFDYDPVSKACKGLLIEESRQNIFPYSNAFSTQWTNAGGSIAANDAISPANTQTASKLTGARYRAPGLAAATRTISCFAKKLDGNNLFTIRVDSPTSLSAVYDLNAGTVSSTPAGWTTSMQNFGNGWYRCIATLPDAIVNAVLISPNGGGASCYIWEAQLEAGAFATSLIPTNGSSLTRNADVVSMTGTNFSSWFNASEGTLVSEFEYFPALSGYYPSVVSLRPSISALSEYSIELYFDTTGVAGLIRNAWANQAIFNTVLTKNTFNTAAISYKTNVSNYACNGANPSTQTPATIPSGLAAMQIGMNTSAQQINAHIKNIYYYNTCLLARECQAFSK